MAHVVCVNDYTNATLIAGPNFPAGPFAGATASMNNQTGDISAAIAFGGGASLSPVNFSASEGSIMQLAGPPWNGDRGAMTNDFLSHFSTTYFLGAGSYLALTHVWGFDNASEVGISTPQAGVGLTIPGITLKGHIPPPCKEK
jgi:hypothetical protein